MSSLGQSLCVWDWSCAKGWWQVCSGHLGAQLMASLMGRVGRLRNLLPLPAQERLQSFPCVLFSVPHHAGSQVQVGQVTFSLDLVFFP